jgi:hypothetical protein
VDLATTLRTTVKRAAAAADRVGPDRRGIIILLYHRVGAGTSSEVDLPAGLFDDQMAALADSGRAMSLDAALATLDAPDPPTEDPVVVSFDDGTGDFVDVAVPILERHAIPATLYVATRWVDAEEPFWGEGTPLGWSGLAEAVATGLVTIGSHTHAHLALETTAVRVAAADLDLSMGLIRDNLDIDPRHFAYPKAIPPRAATESIVRDRFVSAALAGNRVNPHGATDRHRLGRTPIQTSDGMRWFAHKLDGGMRLEGRLRELLDRRRYAGAES